MNNPALLGAIAVICSRYFKALGFPRSRAFIFDIRIRRRVYWFSAGLRLKDWTAGAYSGDIL